MGTVEKMFMVLFEKNCELDFTILPAAHLALMSLHAPILGTSGHKLF